MNTIHTDTPKKDMPVPGDDPQQEILKLLRLANAQIAYCLHEGEVAIGTLTKSFTAMASQIETLSETGDPRPETEAPAQRVHTDGATAHQDAVSALQFYDRVTQRLTHVAASLAALDIQLEKHTQQWQAADWQALRETILSTFTMQSEHHLFEAVLAGASVQQAIQRAAQPEQSDNDVEFF